MDSKLIVPETSPAGRIINTIFTQYAVTDKTPRYRGKQLCFLYLNGNEPMITIGPDWKYSIAYWFFVNFFVGISINSLEHDTFMFTMCYLALLAWDMCSLYLILLNPGVASIDPRIHNGEYLNFITSRNIISRLCMTCNLIHREGGAFRASGYCRTVEHCELCDVCIEGHDHHDKYLGKCIGTKTAKLFTLYLFLSVFQAFSFVFCGLMLMGIK